ncbi:MAG TPA: signal recognition particle-docking protein FtsY [Zeimonas sp.]
MFGFLRRKRPSAAESSPSPDDSASSGAATAPKEEAARGGIGVPAQSLYPSEMLYPAEVLRPAEAQREPGPQPKPEPEPQAQPQQAQEKRAIPEPGPEAPLVRQPPPPEPQAEQAPQPAAVGQPTTAEQAPQPTPTAPTPPLESAVLAPSPEPIASSAVATAPVESPSSEPAADASRTAAAEATASFGSLYPRDVLARPEAIVLPSGDAVVTLPEAERRTWMERLREGMSRTRGNLAGLFSNVQVDDALFEELESALIASDAGVATTQWLMERLQDRVRRDRLDDAEQVRLALRALLVELLMPLEKPMDIDAAEPLVMMVAGVNGAGKTTSIGKLAHHLQREGKSILLAAGDTFRAAAREQLAEWGSRNRVEVIAQQGGDPAAVAFDAVHAGRARRTGIVIIDTAGRLPTQTHLMDELRKIRRVVGKAMDGAPHETLLVLDGNTGQNMLAQVRAFDDAVPLTGLIVTKLDGTAKGGALAALAYTRRERQVPVYFIGVGEKIGDLQAFSAEEFAGALLD